jgi:hypothetical protein
MAVPDRHSEVRFIRHSGLHDLGNHDHRAHLGPYLNMGASGNPASFELAAFYLFNQDCPRLIAERHLLQPAG